MKQGNYTRQGGMTCPESTEGNPIGPADNIFYWGPPQPRRW